MTFNFKASKTFGSEIKILKDRRVNNAKHWFLVFYKGDVEMINTGSSLKMCLVAEGKADEYPRFGPTMEWDTAAGQAILESAGAKLLRESDKQPLTYNREELRNPSFIALRE